MDTTTTQTTESGPALSLDWRPWFGDESEVVAYASTEPTTQHPWGLEVGVRVNWRGHCRLMFGDFWGPWLLVGADMVTAQVEGERRLRLLVEALSGRAEG